ncbi:hypothetical protein [Erwinia sp. JH02]|uniref:hypothetical protein n=1 Tax=Erwinia sp. JH02 TaxID=2733394 RepID=UPI00148837E3|nr:hypothetical protein [Erwinia sp. JH02]NNS10006.1 hypothetical protein [Erwinia sp. JH02]
MKKLRTVIIGVVIIAGCVFAYNYWSIGEGRKQDILACGNLSPTKAAEAVINDVINPGNKIFSRFDLVRSDVNILTPEIQIEETMAYVPFTLPKNKNQKYIAMPRCSVLSDVEYSKE